MHLFSEFRTLILCALILLVAGCVTTTPFTKTETLQGKSLLYIFRPDSLLSRGSQVRVDIAPAPLGRVRWGRRWRCHRSS